jgi:hypothetical protein
MRLGDRCGADRLFRIGTIPPAGTATQGGERVIYRYPLLLRTGITDMSGWFTLFTNCRYVHNGELVDDHLVISDETGLILKREGYIGGEAVDLDDNIIAPGFLELHTNGANGFHFTHFDDSDAYASKVDNIARYYATQGVTGFWATIPTVKGEEFQKASHTMSPSKILRLTHPARSSLHWPPAKSPPPPPSSAPTQRDPTSTHPRMAPTTPRSSNHA